MMSFEEFFIQVWGYAPYPWQADLAQRVAQIAVWPEQIAAPTGLGKTSCLDVAVWALAQDVARHGVAGRTQPLRVALGVERRLIVDGAGMRAEQLSLALEQARGTDTALGQVAAALEQLLPEHERAHEPVLKVASLHGGITRAWFQRWERPVGAMVITGTMTQLASRVLFRGVGESVSRRSVAAGILGVDCVRLCDEPHLSQPAVHTLIEQGELAGIGEYAHRPAQTVVLGATVPPSLQREDALDVDRAGQGGAAAAPERTLEVIEVGEVESVTALKPAAVLTELAGAVAERAAAEFVLDQKHIPWAGGQHQGGVVVVVSTTALATAVAAALKKAKVAHQLVTSRVRPVDRATVTVPDPQQVIVATQTLESGVDYDARVIISDLAPLPALLQRAGRCNRRGRLTGQQARVVVVFGQQTLPGTEAVYGAEPVQATRELLCAARAAEQDQLEQIELDDSVWSADPIRESLTPAMVDLLADTRARAPWEQFLTGLGNTDQASVRVCFRDQPELLGRVPAADGEVIELPLHIVRDVASKKALYWVSRPGAKVVQQMLMAQVYPGDTVALDARTGGRVYSSQFGWGKVAGEEAKRPVRDHSAELILGSGLGGAIPARAVLSRGQIEQVLDGELSLAECVGEEIAGTTGTALWSLSADGQVITIPGPSPREVARRGTPVLLADHLDQVARWSRDNAVCAGVPAQQVGQYQVAGLHHDLGKAHVPFQQVRLGNVTSVPWAKSMRSASGTGRGDELGSWRHEAVIAARMEPGLAQWLVASHHGRGEITSHGDQLVRTVDPAVVAGTDPWSLGLHSALLRSADWAASAKPDADQGLCLDDLELEVDWRADLSEVPEAAPETAAQVHRLTGLAANPGAGALSAYGVLDAVRAAGDGAALLRLAPDGVFELATTVPLDGSVDLWNPVLAWTGGVVQHHKLWLGGLMAQQRALLSQQTDRLFSDMQPRLNAQGNKKKKDKQPVDPETDYQEQFVVLASALRPNNSNPLQALAESVPPEHWYEVLVNPDVGWVASKAGGFDTGDRAHQHNHGAQSLARPAVLAWAGRGQFAWGQAQSELGAGTVVTSKGKLLTLPVPQRWSDAQMVQAAARRGVGEKWELREVVQKTLLWREVSAT